MSRAAICHRDDANRAAGVRVQRQQSTGAKLCIVRMCTEYKDANLFWGIHKPLTPIYRLLHARSELRLKLPGVWGQPLRSLETASRAVDYHRTEQGVDYRFVLGRAFRLEDQTYVASALGKANGVDVVRAAARVNGEQVMRIFPANTVVDNLLYAEEIELAPVTYF